MPRPSRFSRVATTLVALPIRIGRRAVARSIFGAVLALSSVTACDGGNGPAANDAPGTHRVAFAVTSSLNAAPGAVVDARVTYQRPGGGTTTIGSASLTTGTADSNTLPLSADVSECLNAAASAGSTCRVTLTLQLKRDTRLLDENSQSFDITTSTSTVQVAAIDLYEVATVIIAPGTIPTVEPGDTQTLTATARDRSNLEVTGRTPTWEVVSGNVTITSAGVLRAVGAGEARIRATIGGRQRELTFTVSPPSVASIQVAPLDTTVSIGGTVTYRLVARSAAGDILAGRPITLASSNTSIATIAGGVATAAAAGQTTITAQSTEGRGGTTISATATLRVESPPPIRVDRSTVALDTVESGASSAVSRVAVTTTAGRTIGALRAAVTYTPAVTPWLSATLDATTTPTILNLQAASGTLPPGAYAADVRLTSATDAHEPVTVRVTMQVAAPSVATIDIAPADTTVGIGGTVAYRLIARSATGAALTGRAITLTSSNTSVATIAGSAATALATGQATITARSTEGRGGSAITATATLRVDAPPPILVDRATVVLDTIDVGATGAAARVNVTTTAGRLIGGLRADVTYSPAVAPWLTATLNPTNTPTTLTLQASSGTLPAGDYTADVRLTSATSPHVPATVRVNLRVATVRGRFSGVVLNAVNGNPIGQATATIRRADGTTADASFTDGNGRFTSNPIPGGTYSITYTAPGYQATTLLNQTPATAAIPPTTPLPVALLVPTGAGSGTISGSVRDATTNAIVVGATVELRAGGANTTGTILATAVTNSDGGYIFPPQSSGTYTVRGTRVGFVEGSVLVTVPGTSVTAPTVFLSPGTSTIAWRVVLTWANLPSDLDAHLTGPIPNSASRFHVYFVNTGSLTANPFARLDVDEVDGFGPETITIAQQFAGVYRYYVYNYSQDGPITGSRARVDLYKANSLVSQFFVPQGSGTYWTVFEIDGPNFTTINTVGSTQPALRIDAPSAAVSEGFNLFRQMPGKPARRRR